MMILAIISSVVCFAAAVFMFTPYFRKITLLRPLAVYLIFQGAWTLLSYALLQLNPNNGFIFPLNYIATIIIIVYYIFIMAMTKLKSRSKRKKFPDRQNRASETQEK